MFDKYISSDNSFFSEKIFIIKLYFFRMESGKKFLGKNKVNNNTKQEEVVTKYCTCCDSGSNVRVP